MLRRLLTSVVDHQAVQQEGDGGQFLVGHVNPHRCVTRSTISTSAAFCIILWRRHEGLHVIMDALPVTEDSVHQCRWHNMFVSRLVLWAWVKATVGVGELLTHHYGSLNHPVNCKHTHINPHLKSGLHHHILHQTGCVLLWCRGSWVTGKFPWSAGVHHVH